MANNDRISLTEGEWALIAGIIAAAAEVYGITTDQLLGKRRYYRVVRARDLAIYSVRRITGATYLEIGRIFNRDYSTCIAAVTRLKEYAVEDAYLDQFVEEHRSKVNGSLQPLEPLPPECQSLIASQQK